MHTLSKKPTKELVGKLQNMLPTVFNLRLYKEKVKELLSIDETNENHSILRELLKSPSQIPIAWNKNSEIKFFTFKKNSADLLVIDLLKALQPLYFLSHHSALYMHQLTDQRPENFFMTMEIKNKIPSKDQKITSAKIRQSFLKEPRFTEKFLTFKKNKIYLLEKHDLKKIGVQDINYFRQTSEDQKFALSVTTIERTLIDAVVSPHYCGGLSTVIDSFSKGDIVLEILFKIYNQYNLNYPYWQNIGFILEHTKGKSIADLWMGYFNLTLSDFYLSRPVRSHFLYNEKWKVHYPKGIIQQ